MSVNKRYTIMCKLKIAKSRGVGCVTLHRGGGRGANSKVMECPKMTLLSSSIRNLWKRMEKIRVFIRALVKWISVISNDCTNFPRL